MPKVSTDNGRLAPYIRAEMKRRGKSVRVLASEAGVAKGTLERILKGKRAEAETLVLLARALGIHEFYLLYLAGHLEVNPLAGRDPIVEKTADRLNRLPVDLRLSALKMIAPIVDTVWAQAEAQGLQEETESPQPDKLEASESGADENGTQAIVGIVAALMGEQEMTKEQKGKAVDKFLNWLKKEVPDRYEKYEEELERQLRKPGQQPNSPQTPRGGRRASPHTNRPS